MLTGHRGRLSCWLVGLALCLAPGVWAAEEDRQWTPIGPFVSDVRALAIEGDGNGNPNVARVYAGTFGKGVFWSADGGLTWTQGTGTDGEFVTSLVIDPITPATLYAGTFGSGVLKSTNSGVTWAATGLTSTFVHSLAIDADTPSRVYAGTDGGGVQRTTNSGTTWAAANVGLTNLVVFSLAIDSAADIVLAGTDTGGVFKSTNGADNWFPVNTGLSNRVVKALAMDPMTPTTVYAGTDGNGVFKSEDCGGSWSQSSPAGERIFSLAVDPDDSAIVYAGADSNVFKSGSVVDNGLEGLRIPAVALDPDDPNIVYAATRGGGVFKALDQGANWFVSSFDLGGRIGIFVESVAVDPESSEVLYAGTFQGGVFKSEDMGTSWDPASTGLPNFVVRDLLVDPEDPAILYGATAGGGVSKSVDGAGTWAATGLSAAVQVRDLAFDPTDSEIVYAAGGGVHRSMNGGASWTKISTPAVDAVIAQALAIDPDLPTVNYAGTQKGGVFKSDDDGASWIPCNIGLTDPFVRALAIDPSDPQVLYAGTNSGGVFKTSSEGCESGWSPANNGIEASDMNVQAIAIDPLNPARLYAGTFSLAGKGVYRSLDNGDTWTPCDTGLTNQKVLALAIDPGTPSNVYAGTDGAGVYKISGPAVIVDPTFGLLTSEDGGSSKFTVSLSSEPDQAVTVPLTSSDETEGTVVPAELVFTPGGPLSQEVTVIGLPDEVADGDQAYQVDVGPSVSFDPAYDGLGAPSAAVLNLNIDPAGVTAQTLETATLGATGQLPGATFQITNLVYLGAKFTIAETSVVTSIGGHLVGDGNGDLFAAVVPLVGADSLPLSGPNLDVEGTAAFGTAFTPPGASAEVGIFTNFQLDPGNYGLVFGSNQFGATGTGWMPGNDVDTGGPEYFFGDVGTSTWFNGVISNARFFMNLAPPADPDLIFADGFERGNITAWECLPPIMSSFTVEEDFGGNGQTIRVTDTSMGGVSEWLWDFGDGTTSTDQVPDPDGIHVYGLPGNYTVSLTVRRGEVCVDTSSVLVDAN